MLVCHCRVVNDRTIREAVVHGACDVDDVIDRCGAGGECGGCIPSIEDLLADAVLAVADPGAVAARQAGRRCHTPAVAGLGGAHADRELQVSA